MTHSQSVGTSKTSEIEWNTLSDTIMEMTGAANMLASMLGPGNSTVSASQSDSSPIALWDLRSHPETQVQLLCHVCEYTLLLVHCVAVGTLCARLALVRLAISQFVLLVGYLCPSDPYSGSLSVYSFSVSVS